MVSNLCVLDIGPEGFRLIELAPGVTLDEVRAKTDAEVQF